MPGPQRHPSLILYLQPSRQTQIPLSRLPRDQLGTMKQIGPLAGYLGPALCGDIQALLKTLGPPSAAWGFLFGKTDLFKEFQRKPLKEVPVQRVGDTGEEVFLVFPGQADSKRKEIVPNVHPSHKHTQTALAQLMLQGTVGESFPHWWCLVTLSPGGTFSRCDLLQA